MTSEPSAPPAIDDTYAYQREELLLLLRRLSKTNEPLVIHGAVHLSSDDATRLLHKIRQGSHFSERERRALIEAGFDVQALFPTL